MRKTWVRMQLAKSRPASRGGSPLGGPCGRSGGATAPTLNLIYKLKYVDSFPKKMTVNDSSIIFSKQKQSELLK